MKRLGALLMLCGMAGALFAAPVAGAEGAPNTEVRVLILDEKSTLHIVVGGWYRIYAWGTHDIIKEGRAFDVTAQPVRGGIRIGRKDYLIGGITVRTSRNSDIYIDRKPYRGAIDIVRKDNGKLEVVNHIGLDDYLYGVLYNEVSHRWPLELLKAQAIAARTFALYQTQQNRLQPYDLRSDIYSQVYGGKGSEKRSTNMAVDATRGEVLAWQGALLPAYYHATCAGHTEDAGFLWSVDLAPLKGVVCGYCAASPHYRWTQKVPLERLEAALRAGGYTPGLINSVRVVSVNNSGRADKIEIQDIDGRTIILTSKDFRQMLGPNIVRSTKFTTAIRWRTLVLEGQGWGHGVGLCQWGAAEMARQGKSAVEILSHYYPGAEIVSMDTLHL